VHYRPGFLDKARVVQSYLGGVGHLTEDKAVVEADVSLVLGEGLPKRSPRPAHPPRPPQHRRLLPHQRQLSPAQTENLLQRHLTRHSAELLDS
jgi:hypothetical protein